VKPYLTTVQFSDILKKHLVYSEVTSLPHPREHPLVWERETHNPSRFSREVLWAFAKMNFLSELHCKI